jgi:hypothetical protein
MSLPRRPTAALAGLALLALAATPALAGGMPPGFEEEDSVYLYDPSTDSRDPFADPYGGETIGLEESAGDVTTGEAKIEMNAADGTVEIAAVDEAPTGAIPLAIIPGGLVARTTEPVFNEFPEAGPREAGSGIVGRDHR